jgi:pimeloyl-ACP methyl ester carboxylesterase
MSTMTRRQFTQALAATLVTSSVSSCSSPAALAPPAGDDRRQTSGQNTSLGPIKQVDAGVLNLGYAEFGPATGPPVVLLHGWPYDACSFIDVGPLLAAKGYRVIVPYLRGYGPTTFLSADTVRNAQQSAVALDIVALMDALGIERAVIAGFDWGARTAGVLAALRPERCKALVVVSGYLITNIAANQKPLPPAAEWGWWYQYYFATEHGVRGYRENRHDFNKLIWKIVSPKWAFDDATYARTAASFDNADHVDIVIHNYRWRLGLAPGEPEYDALEQKLAAGPAISVPTITIASDFDGAAANGTAYRGKFTGPYEHRVFEGIGHNVPQEAPEAFAQAVVDVDRL